MWGKRCQSILTGNTFPAHFIFGHRLRGSAARAEGVSQPEPRCGLRPPVGIAEAPARAPRQDVKREGYTFRFGRRERLPKSCYFGNSRGFVGRKRSRGNSAEDGGEFRNNPDRAGGTRVVAHTQKCAIVCQCAQWCAVVVAQFEGVSTGE